MCNVQTRRNFLGSEFRDVRETAAEGVFLYTSVEMLVFASLSSAVDFVFRNGMNIHIQNRLCTVLSTAILDSDLPLVEFYITGYLQFLLLQLIISNFLFLVILYCRTV